MVIITGLEIMNNVKAFKRKKQQIKNLLFRSGAFDGRYCLVDFAVPDTVKTFECEHDDPLEVSLGACLPRSCSAEENTYLVEREFFSQKFFLKICLCFYFRAGTQTAILFLKN